jgi:hypothetical protein
MARRTGGVVCRVRVEWRAVKRRLFAILSALSLLLLVAVCVLWVRSYTYSELLWYQPGAAGYSIYSARGELGMRRRGDDASGTRPVHAWGYYGGAPGIGRYVPPYAETRWLGFWFESGSDSFRGRPAVGAIPATPPGLVPYVAIVIPHGLLALLGALLPVVWGVSLIRRVRARGRDGLCPSCNYDLRATPGRCPECGNTPVKSSA